MTRTCHRSTRGMAISILASLVFTQAGAAMEESPSRRHVSPRLIINVPRGSMDGLDSVAYGPAGQLVVSGQWDGQVRVHDPVTGKELRRIDVGPSHYFAVAPGTSSAAFNTSRNCSGTLSLLPGSNRVSCTCAGCVKSQLRTRPSCAIHSFPAPRSHAMAYVLRPSGSAI